MENRKPFQLRKIIVFYNFFQVIFSAWLFWGLGSSGWFTNYSYRCQPVDYSRSAQAMRVINHKNCLIVSLIKLLASFRWLTSVGGIILASLQNSSIHFSLCWENVSIRFLCFMSFTMELCLLVYGECHTKSFKIIFKKT